MKKILPLLFCILFSVTAYGFDIRDFMHSLDNKSYLSASFQSSVIQNKTFLEEWYQKPPTQRLVFVGKNGELMFFKTRLDEAFGDVMLQSRGVLDQHKVPKLLFQVPYDYLILSPPEVAFDKDSPSIVNNSSVSVGNGRDVPFSNSAGPKFALMKFSLGIRFLQDDTFGPMAPLADWLTSNYIITEIKWTNFTPPGETPSPDPDPPAEDGGMIGNILDGIKDLFLPEEGFFEGFFQDLKDKLNEKTGSISGVIDTLKELFEKG